MTKKTVYLAGPIMLAADADGWRDRATALIPLDWNVINPRHTEQKNMSDAEIVALDYGCILRSKVVLAAVGKPSWGTAMEIAFAMHHGVPVVGWGRPRKVSKWLRYHTNIIFADMQDAVEHILKDY